MSAPRVSVVMTAWNEAASIERALRSLLAQTLEDFEIIVVDDGSTDGTAAAVEQLGDPRIRLLSRRRRRGISFSRNEAIAAARGRYVAVSDADDVSLPERLERQARFLDEHPGVAVCGTWGLMRAGDGEEIELRQPCDHEAIVRALPRTCPLINTSIMGRVEVLKAHPYDRDLLRAEDYDLFLRLARRHRLANLPNRLVRFETSRALGYQLHDQWWKTRVRTRAILRYGYPLREAFWLLTPLPALLIPPGLKVTLRRLLSDRSSAGKLLKQAAGSGPLGAAFLKALALIAGSFAAARLASMATQLYAGKVLGAREFGAANIVLAVSAVLQIVLMLGFPVTLSKYLAMETSDEQRARLLSTVVRLELAWSIASASVLLLLHGALGRWLGMPPRLFLQALLLAVLSAWYTVATSALQGLKRFNDRSKVETVYGGVVLIGFLALTASGIRTYHALIGALGLALASGLAGALWGLRGILRRPSGTAPLRGLLSYSTMATLTLIAAPLAAAPGRIALNHWHSMHDVGVFSAYFMSSVQIALAGLYMLNAVLIPMTSTVEGQRGGWRKLAAIGPWAWLGGTFLFSGSCTSALIFYGSGYPLDLPMTVLFGATASLVLLNGAVGSLYAARSLRGLRISVAGAMIGGLGNAALNLWLTPHWGVSGAAVSLAAAQAAALAWLLFFIPGKGPVDMHTEPATAAAR